MYSYNARLGFAVPSLVLGRPLLIEHREKVEMETQMTTHLQQAKENLFGEAGLRASNFKLYPGNARDATVEQVSAELNRSLERLKAGDFEVVAQIGDE